MTSPPPRDGNPMRGESIRPAAIVAADVQPRANTVRRILRRRDAIGIIVGIVIGAGIYRAPPTVAGTTGDIGWLLVAWLLGGLISFAGALCYAELATKYPHAGGDYHFLTRAFGRRASFLYAWARAMVINPGAIALLAFVFGDYMASAWPTGPGTATWAIAIVVSLTVMNVVGLRASASTQNLLALLEVAGLVAVAVAGFLLPGPGAGVVTAASVTSVAPITAAASASASASAMAESSSMTMFSSAPSLSLFGLAMVFVLLTYGGWNEGAYISAELEGGRRAIVTSLIASIAIVTVVYIVVNMALVHGLGLKGLEASKTPAADVVAAALGPVAAKLLAVLVAVAALTSINATMIVGARSNYALGGDWASLRWLFRWDAARGVPLAGHLVQSAIALALVIFGTYQHDGFEAMVEFTAPVYWAFLFLVGIALFVLRSRDADFRDASRPDDDAPYRVPLYPLTPIVFCAACGYLFYSSVSYAASRGAVHVSLIAMAVGFIALIAIEAHRRLAPDQP